ncbi:hypothetical protein Afe04nite_79740 [Asanoa ferruginea]|nr:hypothetical protein Afe04nite_79740 [Asanoa ferruginea]
MAQQVATFAAGAVHRAFTRVRGVGYLSLLTSLVAGYTSVQPGGSGARDPTEKTRFEGISLR